jgi:hypothetical protein
MEGRLREGWASWTFFLRLGSYPCVATGNKTICIAIHRACNKTNNPIFVSTVNDVFRNVTILVNTFTKIKQNISTNHNI